MFWPFLKLSFHKAVPSLETITFLSYTKYQTGRRMTLSKKIVMTLLFTFTLALSAGLPSLAQGATQVPIQTSSGSITETIAWSELEDGSVYVPVRLLFEYFDATVDWQAENQTIAMQRCNGAVITMTIGNKTATITHNQQKQTLNMDKAPQIQQGRTMVPLRFAAENLLCQVDWLAQEKKVRITKAYITNTLQGDQYTIHLNTGDVYAKIDNQPHQLLGRLDGFSQQYQAIQPDYANITKVEQPPNGNHIISMTLEHLDSQTTTELLGYIHKTQQTSRLASFQESIWGAVDNYYCFDGTNLWWPEKEQVVKIEDSTGQQETSYNYQDILQKCLAGKNDALLNDISKVGFDFCDGKQMLLNYYKESTYNTKYFLLVNLETHEWIDLIEKIIPAEERKDFIKQDNISPCLLYTSSQNSF